MDYTQTVLFEGSTEKAFDLAATSLTSLGFHITVRNRETLSLTGPGMTSTRQSALLGASRLHIRRGARDLTLEAELGGAQRLSRFATFFPAGLILVVSVVLALVFSIAFAGADRLNWLVPLLLGSVANGLVWLILGPSMGRLILRRTQQALDALLHNMTMTGNAA